MLLCMVFSNGHHSLIKRLSVVLKHYDPLFLFFKEKELAVKERYQKIKGKSQEIITTWEDKSREFVMGFIDLFGKDSVVVSFF